MTNLSRSLGAVIAAFCLAAPAPAATAPVHVPILRENFADPFIIAHRGEFVGYATNRGVNLPIATSRDLVNWRLLRDPKDRRKLLDGMPVLAPWVREGRTWAPEVIAAGGRWLLYYTARHRTKDRQCVGVAVAAAPTGPFRDRSSEPLVCQDALGGTIDAHPFRDADGQLYLYYKNDGNGANPPITTRIWAQRLARDGLRLTGAAVPLVQNDRHWEWRVVEAPVMVRRPGGYTLFFSGNHFGWEADSACPTTRPAMRNAKGRWSPAPTRPKIRGCAATMTYAAA